MYFAELSGQAKDLVQAGAPGWTSNVGYAIGVCLAIGLILFFCIRVIKKISGAITTDDKTTKTTTKAKKQTGKETTKETSDDYDDGL